MNNFFNIFKDNQKLKYAVNIFILLVIISLVLKLDTSKITEGKDASLVQHSSESQDMTAEGYIYSLEKRLENILLKSMLPFRKILSSI